MAEQRIDLTIEIGAIFEEKFEILSLLGRGGNGVVYKAKHVLLSQLVALKVMNPSSSDAAIAGQRFQREAALLSRLDHPNIVKIHSYGVLPDGRQYMALEYIEGNTLAAILEQDIALSGEHAVSIFEQICHGLEYAHLQGVVHRDIKPANVILGDDGKAKILDFGIFKDLEVSNQSLTKTGIMLGSANYMSPEQCRRETLDARSDIYSLGCLMYETLVGQPPMQDSSEMAVMSNQIQRIVRDVPAKHGISENLKKVILKCLEKDSAKRFQSARELSVALQDCAQSPFIQEKKVPSRSKIILVASSIAVAVALCGLAYFSHLRGQQTKEALSGIAPSTAAASYESGKVPPPDSQHTVKATLQRERWILRNASHASAKDLMDQFSSSMFGRKQNKMPLPPPHGALVQARLQTLLDETQDDAAGHYGLLRELAFVSAIIGDDASVERNIALLEKKGNDPILEGNRTKALLSAVMSISMVYDGPDQESKLLALLKRVDAGALPPVEKIEFYDSLALTYSRLRDVQSAQKAALQSVSILEGLMTKPNWMDPMVIYPVFSRLNQVGRTDLVFSLIKKLPPITAERKSKDPNWRKIECELANAYLARNELEKAKQIYLSNIDAIRDSENTEEYLGAEVALMRILHLQGNDKELIKSVSEYLAHVRPSSYVTASKEVTNLLMQWHVDATPLAAQIEVVAQAKEKIDPNRAVRLYLMLGRIFQHADNSARAVEYFEQARKLGVSLGDEHIVASAMTGKMGAFLALKQWAALLAERDALNKLPELLPDDRFAAEEMYGLYFESQEQFSEAMRIYERILAPYTGKKDVPGNYWDCVLHLAICYHSLGDDAKALATAETGIAVAKRAAKHASAKMLYGYAIKLCEKSDPAKANKYKKTLAKLHRL